MGIGYCMGHQYGVLGDAWEGNFNIGGTYYESDPECADKLNRRWVQMGYDILAKYITPNWPMFLPLVALAMNALALFIPSPLGSRVVNLIGNLICGLGFVAFMMYYEGIKGAVSMANDCPLAFSEIDPEDIRQQSDGAVDLGDRGEFLSEMRGSKGYLGTYFRAGLFGYFFTLVSTGLLAIYGSSSAIFGDANTKMAKPDENHSVASGQMVILQGPGGQQLAPGPPSPLGKWGNRFRLGWWPLASKPSMRPSSETRKWTPIVPTATSPFPPTPF